MIVVRLIYYIVTLIRGVVYNMHQLHLHAMTINVQYNLPREATSGSKRKGPLVAGGRQIQYTRKYIGRPTL